MRTNELHANSRQVQRSDGRGAVRAAAYRSASKLYDERTGLTHDYTRKAGVEFTRIYTPAGAPEWAGDRSKLWNAAEAKENRKNSMTAREWIIAFPYEFNAMQRREAGDTIAHEIMARTGAAVDICYHLPDRGGDQRNFHAHVLYTTRGFDPESKDGWSRTKYRNFSLDKIEVDGEEMTRLSAERNHMRDFIAGEMNRISARDGLAVHTEKLSFKERGIEQEPTVKLGPVATDMERKGQKSERGDENRAIRAANENREELRALREEMKVVDLAIEREKRRLASEATRETLTPDPRREKEKELLAARERAQEEYRGVSSFWSRLFRRKEFEAAYERMQEAENRLESFRQSDTPELRTAWGEHSKAEQEKIPRERKKPGLSSLDEWEDAGLQKLAQEPPKPANQNRPQDSPAASMRSEADIAHSVRAHGWSAEKSDLLKGLKPEFEDKAQEAMREAKAEPSDQESEGESHDHGPRVDHD